ncbi:hypothetical protein L3Q82_004436 [Scortum barcoo]|uniref:Uncharacterized protein n=1 Tax=Scortum barcoo TaxID=214431 RepID=A0ACB8VJU4_9TELE|nr:hypothetical protein L3Q82_004436 [Scortum barcoo]
MKEGDGGEDEDNCSKEDREGEKSNDFSLRRHNEGSSAGDREGEGGRTKREKKRACVVLGVVFVLSSLCILGKAIHDLATRVPPEVDDFLFSVSIVSGLTCAVLAVAKFMLGRVLTSRALITDGFNSMVGAIMGFSILISAEVFKHHADVWFLDGTIGVLIGLIILAYGVKLLKDMVPRVRQTRNYERFE